MTRASEERSWKDSFGFLENLYVVGMVREGRGVPKESGVQFYINKKIKDEGICFIFSLDWGGARPLIGNDEIKPDYLVVFAPCAHRWKQLQASKHEATLYCTLVEMKGREQHNLKHGIDQLCYGYRKLVQEFQALPKRLRIRWQGILLCPFNADIPRQYIVQKSKPEFPIRPVQGGHAVDLYDYIRGPFPDITPKQNGAYQPQESFRPLERVMMASCATPLPSPSLPRQGLRLKLAPEASDESIDLVLGDESALSGATSELQYLLRRELVQMRARHPSHGYRASSCNIFKLQKD